MDPAKFFALGPLRQEILKTVSVHLVDLSVLPKMNNDKEKMRSLEAVPQQDLKHDERNYFTTRSGSRSGIFPCELLSHI